MFLLISAIYTDSLCMYMYVVHELNVQARKSDERIESHALNDILRKRMDTVQKAGV